MSDDTTKAIVEDIRRVANRLNADSLSCSEYCQHGKYSHYQVYEGGNSWARLCEQAGILSKTKLPVSDESYFRNLAKAVNNLGRYPRTSERKTYGLNFSKRRYSTLTEFIEKAVELGYVPNLFEPKLQLQATGYGHELETVKFIQSALQNHSEQSRPVPPIPLGSKRIKWERTGLAVFPYAPQEEQGVFALFSILCAQAILPWQILDVTSNGIDATCFDERENREIQVELKYLLSKGSWNHRFEEFDYVVCWENRWPDFPKPVIELSKLIRETQ